MGDFFKTHFDKLLLTALLLTLFFATVHVLHHGPDESALNWLENTVGQVLAALLTLMVGTRMTQRGGDNRNGNATVPAAPLPGAAAPDLPASPPVTEAPKP